MKLSEFGKLKIKLSRVKREKMFINRKMKHLERRMKLLNLKDDTKKWFALGKIYIDLINEEQIILTKMNKGS